MFLMLLIGSALAGLVIGLKCRVFVIGLAAPVLAAVAAIALRDFGFVAATAITSGCLTINQIGYLSAAWLSSRHASGGLRSSKQSDDPVGDNRQGRVPGEHSKHSNSISHLASY